MTLFICNIKDCSEHCKTKCLHGIPHERDECSSYEKCIIVNKRVKCRKLFKKEIKLLKEKGCLI